MKHLVAGTAGHIDHGKTVLVKALTGIDTDRLPEEKRRGISIALGYAWLDLPDGTRIGLVDVPGHERFVRTMVAGAAGIDFVILVVAADDSVMPQTREHLAILHLLGVRDGLIALTKIDLVDAELVEVCEIEAREAVTGTFLADAPIVSCSGVTGAGLEQLKATIAKVAARVPERAAGAVARIPIDRSFAIAGHGTVVTGTVLSGALRVGEDVEILCKGVKARVRGLQSHGSDADLVSAGQRAAVNLAGIKHDELTRGDSVCTLGALRPTLMVDGRVVLDAAVPRPLKHGASVAFHIGTSEVRGRVALLDRLELMPGGQAWAQVRLAEPVVARLGDRFILRTIGGDATLGGGQVLDAHPLKHRRHRAQAAAALEHLANGGLPAAIAHELHKAGEPLRLSTLSPLLGHARADVQAACTKPLHLVPSGGDPWLYADIQVELLRERIVPTLAAHHQAKPLLATGLTLAQLKAKAGFTNQLTDDVVSAMMGELIEDGTLRLAEGTYALASHRVELSEEQAAIREAILQACRERAFSPPTVADLRRTLPFPPDQVAAVHESLTRSGELIDGEVCGFHPQAVDDAWAMLEQHLRQSGHITISEFRELLGTTRRYAMGLMHHFDETGRVVRDGDLRRLPT